MNPRDPNGIVAENLRRLRRERRLSQEKFADLCGLHRTYVGAIERGGRNITLATLLVLSEALDIEPWELLRPKAGRR